MNVLVFGATGFIGKHLVDALLQKNIAVIGVSTDEIHKKRAGYTHVTADITNGASFSFLKGGFDCVFNTAAYITKQETPEEAHRCMMVNALGVYNILFFMHQRGINKLIHSSSCSVYGQGVMVPIDETVFLGPESVYGISKLAGEQFCHIFQKKIPEITIFRYSSVFGKDCHPDTVVPLFIKKALADEVITLYDKGQRSQDFVSVEDVVEANMLALEKEINGVFNITSGKETTMHDLAKDVIQAFSSHSKIVFDHTKKDANRRAYSIAKAKKLLGYSPKFTSVKLMLKDYKR